MPKKSQINEYSVMSNLEDVGEVVDNIVQICRVWGTKDTIIKKYANDKVNQVGGRRSIVNAGIGIAGKQVVKLMKMVEGMIP